MFRKIQFIMVISSLMLLFIIQFVISAQTNTIRKSQPRILPVHLTLADAEKILGQKAHITDSSLTINGAESYKLAFTADSVDEKTGKTGAVYYLFEIFDNAESAKKKYASIRSSNEDHEGFVTLHGIGDEAYYHSDGYNFYFIIVRKAEKMFTMKVNKITSKTSFEEFNSIANKIAASL